MPRTVKKMKPKRTLDRSEHRLRIIATVSVLCLVFIIGIVLLTGSGKGRKGAITAQTGQSASSQPSTSSSVNIESVQVPPLSVYRRRNIFKPLVSMESTQATSATGTAPTTGGAGAGVITLPPELDATGQGAGSVVSTAITLEGIFEQGGKLFARIRVGDNLFDKVAVGEVFGGNYKLLSIGKDSSATILYGDERFTIYAGQSLYW
jgi:hypothetical protein